MSMNTLIILEVKFYSAVLCKALGLGLETRVSTQGLGLGLEFFKKVLTTTLVFRRSHIVVESQL